MLISVPYEGIVCFRKLLLIRKLCRQRTHLIEKFLPVQYVRNSIPNEF